jgi:hypothetical protein
MVILVGPKYTIQGQTGDFVIQNADSSKTFSIVSSPDLNALIANVLDRFAIQSADGNRYYDVIPIPADLLTLITEVSDRFVVSYANANERYNLGYPVELIGDTTPPQASDPTATASDTNAVTIIWTTDEYTTSVIDYGLQPGMYTLNVSDDLYRKNHEILLSDLTAGGVYYYRINDTDRGGNTFQSQEYSFTAVLSP